MSAATGDALRIEVVPCLRDNYAYVLRDGSGEHCAVVDPGEAAPVLAALRAGGRVPYEVDIWCTHHHADHVGGVEALCQSLPVARVLAHASDQGRIPRQSVALQDGDRWTFAGCEVQAMHVPGHTLGALAYDVRQAEKHHVFTGDTLFLGGCGRLFEGDAPMMFDSLQRLAALPPTTLVYCGHEYTQRNLQFLRQVQPQHAHLAAAEARANALRAAGQPTVPGRLAEELQLNPFLRAASLDEWTQLRRARDNF